MHIVQWLEEVFLSYFDKWKESAESREGYEQAEMNLMQLSSETLFGLRITGTVVMYCGMYRC